MTSTIKYPNTVLEKALRERGVDCRCLWEHRGPKNTFIAWIVAYLVNGRVVMVQTYKEGGWDAFTPNSENDVEATIKDVMARTGALANSSQAA